MKSYIDNLEHLGHAMTQNLSVSLILVLLRKEYDGFVQNYNMHSIGKTVTELHAMLKLYEQTLPPKEAAHALHAIRAERIQKNQKKKSHKAAKGNQGKCKAKMGYAPVQVPPFSPKPKNPPTPKKDNPAKDAICHQCGKVGHWRRNCPVYLAKLMKKKKLSQGATYKDQLKGSFYKEMQNSLNVSHRGRGMGEQKESKNVVKNFLAVGLSKGSYYTRWNMKLNTVETFSSEWKTHALIWRNKEEIESISLNDFAAIFKANPYIGDNISDRCDLCFPSSSAQFLSNLHERILEQKLILMTRSNGIYNGTMAMLTIRARRFIKRTGRKLDVNGQRVGLDMSKVGRGGATIVIKMVHFDGIGGMISATQLRRASTKLCIDGYYIFRKFFHFQDSEGNPQQKEYKEKGVIDSGCSRHMIGNKCYLTEYEDYDGDFVSFGDGKGRIFGKEKIKTGTLDFDNLLDESQVLLRVPRKDNIYSVDLKSVVPTKGLTCLFAKATIDESNLWHRRLGHINFKNMNKLVRGNLVREIENQLDHKVKVIRCDNGTEFKNSVMNQLCEMKGIKREFSFSRTPQQNGVAERRNRTLIEAARTMDHLGKFDGKADKGFFVGYSVFFDVNSLTISMNYVPVVAGNQSNGIAGTRDNIVTGPKDSEEDSGMKPTEVDTVHPNSTNCINTVSTPVSTAGPSFTNDAPSSLVNAARTFEEHLFEQFSPFKNAFTHPDVPNVFLIYDIGIFGNAYDDEDVGAKADLNNLKTTMNVSPIPTTRINKDHPKDQIIGDLTLDIQTRRMTKISDEHAMLVTTSSAGRPNMIPASRTIVSLGSIIFGPGG
ncbi:ribonuclease H-like domain-containing protein [Tanacetum coccineum]